MEKDTAVESKLNAKGVLLCSMVPLFLLAPEIERCDKDHPARDVMLCASPRGTTQIG